jgi:hypothetical protein
MTQVELVRHVTESREVDPMPVGAFSTLQLAPPSVVRTMPGTAMQVSDDVQAMPSRALTLGGTS